MRVYELAKELGVSSKDLIAALKKGGFSVATHMAVLTDEMQSYVQESFASEKTAVTSKTHKIQEKKIDSKEPKVAPKQETPLVKVEPVVASRVTSKENVIVAEPEKIIKNEPEHKELAAVTKKLETFEDLEDQEYREQERIKNLLKTTGLTGFTQPSGPRRRKRRKFKPVVREVPKEAITAVTIDKAMPLFEVADMFGKQSGDLILSLLRKGMVCNRNHLLTPDLIKELGNVFNITVTSKESKTEQKETLAKKESHGVTRWPVVVVMGHVDHGKTTLLDYIRKMNVAATEKGGITQHIRAWEVDSTHGKIVFLDTPGHEAFSYLRQRGSKITDIAILVIAADDGIKPQTVEAIKHAKAAGVPIIIAINKIDKIQSPSAIETVKRQLAQHELMPEEWGGQTIIVPISAKTGQGVEELLEMIVLQSQMMDLKSEVSTPAKAFVLESHVEKGFGPVATVIVREGTLKQGDFFICGSSTGKVRILVNTAGARISQALPSTPVQVVGFDRFTGIGDWLTVVSHDEYSEAKFQRGFEQPVAPLQSMQTQSLQQADSKYINLIIKTDTRGSKEAVMGSIDKLIKQHKEIKCPINIVTSGIGDISEGDIELAANTNSLILGLHVHVEKNAQLLAKERDVDIQIYYIIYELVESLEKLLISKKEVAMTWSKVGEAVVKKVFDIKGIGIIAGCYMRDGVLARGNKVVCMRSGRQIGEAKVSTLQRERKSVKEIHAGYECGFTTDGFNEWQEGDTVVVYAEVKAE